MNHLACRCFLEVFSCLFVFMHHHLSFRRACLQVFRCLPFSQTPEVKKCLHAVFSLQAINLKARKWLKCSHFVCSRGIFPWCSVGCCTASHYMDLYKAPEWGSDVTNKRTGGEPSQVGLGLVIIFWFYIHMCLTGLGICQRDAGKCSKEKYNWKRARR